MISQRRKSETEEWEDCTWCGLEPGYTYRAKPEPAAPKWPQTTMSIGKIVQAYQDGIEKGEALMCAVNAVLAHECSTGALVPADKVREIEAKARAEGMREGSVWDTARDRMVARTAISMAIHSRGLAWDSSELDRIMEFIKK